MENQQHLPDVPPAGMGGAYSDWLRYQEKEECRLRRDVRQEQAGRSARNRARAAKAAKTRRKRRRAKQRNSALHGVLVAGVALALLVAGNILKQVWRSWG